MAVKRQSAIKKQVSATSVKLDFGVTFVKMNVMMILNTVRFVRVIVASETRV